MKKHRFLLGAAVALPLALSCGQVADAQEVDSATSNSDLREVVAGQARRIEELETRLKGLEAYLQASAVKPGIVASAPVATNEQIIANAERKIEKSDLSPEIQRILTRIADSESAPPAAHNQPERAGVTFVNGTPKVTSENGRIWFRPRGRLFLDASSTMGASAGSNISGTQLTSARLGMEGAFGKISWALEGEFARNRVVWKSAFINWNHKLLGRDAELSIGNRFNDRSMDGSTGLGSAPFQDFSVVGAAVLPARGFWGLGLQERVYGKNWHFSLQATGEDPNNVGNNSDSFTLISRAHWNPIKTENVTLHVGAWGFYEDIAAGSTGVLRNTALAGDFNTLVRLTPGTLTGVSQGRAFGGELALMAGGFWTQNEWAQRTLSRGGSDWTYSAYSLDAGYYLFGAKPSYDAKRGAWGRVRVTRPVSEGGPGALAIKLRYENIDYTDLPGGGKGSSITGGANWQLNEIARVMVDYIYWDIDNRSGTTIGQDDGQSLNLRFQLQF